MVIGIMVMEEEEEGIEEVAKVAKGAVHHCPVAEEEYEEERPNDGD